MNLEKENQVIPLPEAPNKLKKLSYTTEFLLSISKLDACKKLPSGFDASILSEFEDGLYERRQLTQKRLEGSGGYARANQGRWDARSSGSSDKDGDLQSEREHLVQDTGRRFGNQTQRVWSKSEHDGLLGSGAFPRPSGYSGIPADKARGNDHYQLRKSTEPYQPPRPYKATPYSRKDFTDSYNDETFGSAECSNEDRAEEERKRRASFELMRKEQQKTLLEKQKPNPDNRKENIDIFAMLGNSACGKSIIRGGDKSDESVAASPSHSDSSKPSLHIQAPASRPLVPPGFASASMEKNLSVPTSSTSHTLEAGSALVANDHSLNCMENDHDKNSSAARTQFNMERNEAKGISALFADATEKLVVPTSSAKVLEQAVDSGNVLGMATSIQEAAVLWADDIGKDYPLQNEAVSEIMNTASQDHSTTILEKLFSSALSKKYGNSPNSIEGAKVDEETWSSALSKSSKFAHWFSEDERKPTEDFSSTNLLSLIISNEKVVDSQVSTSPDANAIETALNLHSLPSTSSHVKKPEVCSRLDEKNPTSAVLTCEDLEQLMLAEATGSSPSLQQPTAPRTPLDGNLNERKVNVDDHASQHLLSLLQKGTSSKEAILSPEQARSSEQSITLETFFGSAFMNELHSAEAPVSANRGSAGTVNQVDIMQPRGLQFVHADDGFFSSIPPESRSDSIIHEGEVADIRLPEEDSLITVGDTSKPINSDPFPFENGHRSEEFARAAAAEDLKDRLFGTIRRDGERLHNDPNNHLHGGPYQLRPMFPPLDHLTQRNAHTDFVSVDGLHHDALHFSGNVIPRFDPAFAHHPMLQHVPVPGNFLHPHPHPMQRFPTGVPPPHSINHVPSYIPEMNNMHNFAMHHRPPNYGGGSGMGLPGSIAQASRGHHPEALERLFEMEIRANSKHAHPAVGGHVRGIPGIYSPELDANFRYR